MSVFRSKSTISPSTMNDPNAVTLDDDFARMVAESEQKRADQGVENVPVRAVNMVNEPERLRDVLDQLLSNYRERKAQLEIEIELRREEMARVVIAELGVTAAIEAMLERAPSTPNVKPRP